MSFLRFPIVAALTLLVSVACDAGEPAAPDAEASQAASDSAFVAALRAGSSTASSAAGDSSGTAGAHQG